MKNKLLLIPLFSILFAFVQTTTASESKTWTLARSLYTDPTAQKIGDLLTVLIEEEAEVSMDARNSSRKSSDASGSISFGHPRIDNRPTSWTNVVVPSWTIDTSRSFAGEGSRTSRDRFSSRITVQVTDVMPNGNLLIEGSRSVMIHDEAVKVLLTGVVRPTDISRNNTVKSSSISDTTIRYESSGPLAQNVKRGIITSLLNWLNPF